MGFLYFDSSHAIEVQAYIIEHSGGRKGILNPGLLESVLDHIKNDIYYPNFEDKLCHLFFSINKNHAFSDGNKRSSIVLSAYFLELNGFGYLVSYFIKEMENVAVHVADNRIEKELLYEILKELIYIGEFSQELRFRIVQALSK